MPNTILSINPRIYYLNITDQWIYRDIENRRMFSNFKKAVLVHDSQVIIAVCMEHKQWLRGSGKLALATFTKMWVKKILIFWWN